MQISAQPERRTGADGIDPLAFSQDRTGRRG